MSTKIPVLIVPFVLVALVSTGLVFISIHSVLDIVIGLALLALSLLSVVALFLTFRKSKGLV